MTDYQMYVFTMCLIVFALLATLSVVCVVTVARLYLRLINFGAEDTKILKEHQKKKNTKTSKYMKIVDYAFSGIVCLALLFALISSLVIGAKDKGVVGSIPVYRVVNTGSMEKKNPENEYLYKNNIDNQIRTFDLIQVKKLPDEMDLEVYDIVVYEVDGMFIVHRIIEIEEPNAEHPNCRHFKLQGDAVESPDRFPVLYEQMRGIYSGKRIPFVGSFVSFMQSPAGWLCVMFVFLGMIASPLIEIKIEKAKNIRLRLYIEPEEPEDPECAASEIDLEPETSIEVAEELGEEPRIVVVHARAASGRVGAVGLGSLQSNYVHGDIVDIRSLKAKKLLANDCKRVKIIANGKLETALTVKANSFTAQARDAIVEAGGVAIEVHDLIERGRDN